MLSQAQVTGRPAGRGISIGLLLTLIALSVALVAVPSGNRPSDSSGKQSFTLLAAPTPLVTVTLSPSATVSGATAVVAVSVTLSGAPQAGAAVRLTSSAGGTFSNANLNTGSQGTANATFRAPAVTTTTISEINATATVTGQPLETGSGNITIQPTGAYLVVRTIFPQGANVRSNASLLVEFTVQNNTGAAVAGASVSFAASGGVLAPGAAVTGSTGDVTTVLTAPSVTANTAVFLLVGASASGYVSGSVQSTVNVRTGASTPLFVTVTPAVNPVNPGELVVITVAVHANNATGTAVAGAAVLLILSDGSATPAAQATNASGLANFIFTTPSNLPPGTTITVTASVTAGGFGGGANSAAVNTAGSPSSPTESVTSLWWVWVIVAAVLIVGVLALLVRRGRRPRRPLILATPTPTTPPSPQPP